MEVVEEGRRERQRHRERENENEYQHWQGYGEIETLVHVLWE